MPNSELNNTNNFVRTSIVILGNDTINNYQIDGFQLFSSVYLASVCASGVILNFKALSTLFSVIVVSNAIYILHYITVFY